MHSAGWRGLGFVSARVALGFGRAGGGNRSCGKRRNPGHGRALFGFARVGTGCRAEALYDRLDRMVSLGNSHGGLTRSSAAFTAWQRLWQFVQS